MKINAPFCYAVLSFIGSIIFAFVVLWLVKFPGERWAREDRVVSTVDTEGALGGEHELLG